MRGAATADRGPARGRRAETARFADSRLRVGDGQAAIDGKTGAACSVPAITAKATPSRITSTAGGGRAASRSCSGTLIDPEQSMMMISALSVTAAGAAAAVPAVVTVTIALTSRVPSGRYSFW